MLGVDAGDVTVAHTRRRALERLLWLRKTRHPRRRGVTKRSIERTEHVFESSDRSRYGLAVGKWDLYLKYVEPVEKWTTQEKSKVSGLESRILISTEARLRLGEMLTVLLLRVQASLESGDPKDV